MEPFILSINEIQPSQLYISSKKLNKMKRYIESINDDELEPLPIKKIGNKVFFTDGHTRAYTLYQKGYEKVKVYWDQDELNWLNYLVCVGWCDKSGINDISDLDDRVVEHKKYEKLWIQRCGEMQQRIKADIYNYANIVETLDIETKSEICELILRNLPEWFEIEESIQKYIETVKNKFFLTVKVGEIPVGFIVIKDHNKYTSELYVMGLLKELHGYGLGKKLVNKSCKMLNESEKKFLTVKTLSDSHPDQFYKKTRNFYKAVGFYPLEELKDLWGENNPCLYMVKILK